MLILFKRQIGQSAKSAVYLITTVRWKGRSAEDVDERGKQSREVCASLGVVLFTRKRNQNVWKLCL